MTTTRPQENLPAKGTTVCTKVTHEKGEIVDVKVLEKYPDNPLIVVDWNHVDQVTAEFLSDFVQHQQYERTGQAQRRS